jgi:Uncharacterized protein conserved in archaea
MKGMMDVLSWQEIRREKFLAMLKDEAKLISLQDIMQASLFLIDDARYVQESYRKEYLKAYTLAFITRIKEVKEYELIDASYLDVREVKEALELLLEQEKVATGADGFDPIFFRIYMIVSLYTTFILEEPVHPVGTPFPGGFKVKFDGDKYLCPVKERQKDNPGAVCGFCIAEQDPKTI